MSAVRGRPLLWSALLVYAAVGLALTLVPSNPFDDLFRAPGVDVVVNVVMFAPPVALLLLLRRRLPPWLPVVAVIVISGAVEAAQKWVVESRDASPVDWLLNSAGAAVGAVFAQWLRRLDP